MTYFLDLDFLTKCSPLIVFIAGGILAQIKTKQKHETQIDEHTDRIKALTTDSEILKVSNASLASQVQTMKEDFGKYQTAVWSKLDTMQALQVQCIENIAKLTGAWENTRK